MDMNSQRARLWVHLQVAVAYAKLGVGQPCGDVGMYLGVYIRVDPDQDPGCLVNCLGCLRNVLQVEL